MNQHLIITVFCIAFIATMNAVVYFIDSHAATMLTSFLFGWAFSALPRKEQAA